MTPIINLETIVTILFSDQSLVPEKSGTGPVDSYKIAMGTQAPIGVVEFEIITPWCSAGATNDGKDEKYADRKLHAERLLLILSSGFVLPFVRELPCARK